MNFWQRLRLIGTVVVFALSVLAIALAVLRTPDTDEESSPARPHRAIPQQSGTTGL